VFDLVKIPSFDPENKQLRDGIGNIHALAANSLIILAAIHAGAGLIHHFLWKDGVLQRMIPIIDRP